MGTGLTQPGSGWQYLPAAFHWRHERTTKIAGTLGAKETQRHPAAHRHFVDWIDWPDRLSTKSVDNPVDTNCHRAPISRSIGTAQKTGSSRCQFPDPPTRRWFIASISAPRRSGRCDTVFQMSEIDSPLAQVVGRDLHGYFVAGDNANAVLAHLSRRIGDQRMTVLQCYKKPRIGHDFRDDTLHLQQFFFCQVILRSMNKKSLDDARPFLQPGPENPGQMFCNQAGTTLLACCPFCPRVTSKVTF